MKNHNRALRIRIDLNAIRHNLSIARSRSGGQKLFAVVKADAYGHGAVRVATALKNADGFAVVTLNEAVELRQAGIEQPILVLQSAQLKHECEAFYEHRLWPVIHCAEQLAWFSESQQAQSLGAWIKIDTGMGRLGFQPHELTTIIGSNKALYWMGVLTHFGSADDMQSPQTPQQIALFSNLVDPMLLARPGLQRSLANSAGLLGWPASKADWARPGIMLYGSNPLADADTPESAALQAAMNVSAPVISIKHFNAGDSIGYAASYVCPESMPVGFLGIGYGDGLPRVLDSSASVLLNAHRCPIIGRVSMDSIAIDLRGAGQITLGEHALLWGRHHPVEILASAASTISYELMTSIKGIREYG